MAGPFTSGDPVLGWYEPNLEGVFNAFDKAHEAPRERDAALAVYRDGRCVADLRVGEMRGGMAWRNNTLCCGFSLAKVVTATAIAVLVDRDELDLDAPVSRWWPEFARNGKATITLRMVLTHEAGTTWIPDHRRVVSCDDPESFHDLEQITKAIAEAPPVWEPGSKVGYATMTVGWIASAIVERVTGQTLGAFVAAEVCKELGIHDLFLGVPTPRLRDVVDLVAGDGWDAMPMKDEEGIDTPAGKNLCIGQRPLGATLPSLWNADRFRSAEQGGVNVQASASDLARLMGVWAGRGTVDGTRIIGRATADEFMREQVVADEDVMIHRPARRGLLLWRTAGDYWFGPNDRNVGHIGIGGSFAMADPVDGVALVYLPRYLTTAGLGGTEARLRRIIDAVYDRSGGLTDRRE